MFTLRSSPFRSHLEHLFDNVTRDLLVATPYMKTREAEWVYNRLVRSGHDKAISLRVLTDVRSSNVLSGSLDIAALLEKFEFVEWLVPLETFPFVSLSTDYRDENYVQGMLTPICHRLFCTTMIGLMAVTRIWAWRLQGFIYAKAIDLAELGLPVSEFRLGVLSA